MKLKADYLEEGGDSVDVVVVGAEGGQRTAPRHLRLVPVRGAG